MKRPLLIALFVLTTATSPLLSQSDSTRPARKKSPVKVEMENMEEALDVVSEWLKKPEGDAPMAKITEATVAMVAAKKHAPRATARLPEDKQKEFVKNYQIEINKLLRSILDLEDAMLKDDHKTAEKILGGMKAIAKAGHKTFKPRRRRSARKPGGGDKPQLERPQTK